jgi:hypothetical protein
MRRSDRKRQRLDTKRSSPSGRGGGRTRKGASKRKRRRPDRKRQQFRELQIRKK